MPFLKIIFLCLLPLFSQAAFALNADEILPPEEAFKVTAKAIAADQIEVTWNIAEGYYLYSKKIRIESKTQQIQLGIPALPKGQEKHDENFGNVIKFINKLIQS